MTQPAFDALTPGTRILILTGHPWAGHKGTVTAVKPIRNRGIAYPHVALDDGPTANFPTVVVHASQAEVEG